MDITYLDFIIFICVFCLGLYYYGMSKYNCFDNTDVKHIKPPVPFFGSAYKVVFRMEIIHDFTKKIYDAFPDERYIGLFEGKTPFIMIKDLELIKQVGIKNFDEFHDHRNFAMGTKNDIFEHVLFVMSGEKWKEMRASLSPAFTSSKMKNMLIFIEECAKDFTEFYMNQDDIKEKGIIEIDVKDSVTRYTNDVISNAVFGIKVNSLTDRNNDIYKLGLTFNNFSILQILKFYGLAFFPSLMKLLGISFTPPAVSKFFLKLVNEFMEIREKNGIVRQDMINLLMEIKKGTLSYENSSTEVNDTGFSTVEESNIGKQKIKKEWTDLELAAQALIFFLAGFETTSTFLTFFFYEMARNTDCQKKLHDEIDSFARKSGNKLSYYDIPSLKYLDMCISETLRMWPPLANTDRVCSKSFTLPPPNEHSNKTYEIKKDELIWIPIYGIMKDPKYFPDPDKFDPERFSDSNKVSINPITYLPFGIGPRNCIGSRFALMEIKALIFHTLSKFHIVPVEKTQIPIKLYKGAFQLKIESQLIVGLKSK